MTGSDLSILCFSSDLNKSYLEQKSLNSSEAIAITVKHIDKSIVALIAILQIVNSSILSIFIVFGLINSSFAITLSSFALFSLYYGISRLTSVKLTSNSQIVANSARQQIALLQESKSGIRDIKLQNTVSQVVKNIVL